MFLKEIHIQNFKGFDDLHFSFTKENGEVRKHTILLGENGAGKSNLLKAIALVTASPDEMLELFVRNTPQEWIKYGQKSCRIEARLNYVDSQPLILEWNINDKPFDIIEKYKKNNKDYQNWVYAYGASRKLSSSDEVASTSEFIYKQANKIANLFDNKHLLYPLTKWMFDLHEHLDNEADKKMFDFTVTKLNAFLQNICFYKVDELKMNGGNTPQNLHFKDKKQLIFQENGKKLPLNALSDGYQNMAALIGDLLAKWVDTFHWGINAGKYQNFPQDLFNSISDNQGLILIDEIDLHLHPKWQRALLDFLEKELPSFQIIATTHSPLTAQQASEGELFTLKKEENGKIEVVAFRGSPDKLLISDLLTAEDAFDLHTTESLKVENFKNRYVILKAKKERTEMEEKEWQEIITFLQIIPHKKGSAYFSEEHFHLLQEIKAELDAK